ncbi:MAG: hypothetical protein NC122_00365 [Faecalibacterium sp.]|nr:hypothetical protein [Ruminococcus flavefaciens]MCM1391690.1 hypothetical protein [Ruminococcus sp.]MCM1484642.1 hypothetical protein [Faecalibacterium sp.]
MIAADFTFFIFVKGHLIILDLVISHIEAPPFELIFSMSLRAFSFLVPEQGGSNLNEILSFIISYSTLPSSSDWTSLQSSG